jgi:hypothetical protein
VAFTVRKKTFAYFTDDHHGDARRALICKAPFGKQSALVSIQPEQYFVPPYLGHRGWVGYWLDTPDVDWNDAGELMTDAYRLTAPKVLTDRLG